MKIIAALLCSLGITGCATTRAPIKTVPQVDLKRFMGDWFVIANIPTFVEKGAHNAVESYRLAEDGSIPTTFTFNKGSFDGPEKVYQPRGFVRDTESNAVWRMQFIWPFKADYRIVYLSDDYSKTAVGRNKRDYVWIMARTPTIPETEYEEIVSFLVGEGYERDAIQRVPQAPR